MKANLFFSLICTGVFSLAITLPIEAHAESFVSSARHIANADRLSDAERQRFFTMKLDGQRALRQQSEVRLARAEAEQERLKGVFDGNESKLAELENRLRQRSGVLGEVFGVAKESAQALQATLQDSLTSAELPDRVDALSFADARRIPTLSDLRSLTALLLQEMQVSGEVSRFDRAVVTTSGKEEQQTLLRFGTFSLANTSGDYLLWDVQRQQVVALEVQPAGADDLDAYLNGSGGSVLIDPGRGSLFSLGNRLPDLWERVEQGGQIGYLILALGISGLSLAVWRLLLLLRTEIGVRQQLKNGSVLNAGNPLGRVLQTMQQLEIEEPSMPTGSVEQRRELLEIKLEEAILREMPNIERGQGYLKLLAAVAPLLGLLGTVVGMIATFQSITLFGTGDPKLMASGISQALVTTVLGLVVAVPILFCHSLLANRGRRLLQILQEKSLAALTASDLEQANRIDARDKEQARHAA